VTIRLLAMALQSRTSVLLHRSSSRALHGRRAYAGALSVGSGRASAPR
jgi:hypothetical protein